MRFGKPSTLLQALIISFALSATASAAFIHIDDSNLSTITISAGDFEGAFFVNGNLLTNGLGNSASITLVDGIYDFMGTYTDLNQASSFDINILFALSGTPEVATSGIELSGSNDNSANVAGLITGFTDSSSGFLTALPTLVQNGQTGTANLSLLTVTFISENAVSANPIPEPATMALIGLGVAGIAALRRKIAK